MSKTKQKHVPFTRVISREDWAKRPKGDIVAREAKDDGSEVITVRFSNFTRDDYGTRFDPAGCDLSQYTRNPMVTYCHGMDQGIYSLPVGRGKVDTFQVREDGLYMDIEFTPEEVFEFGALVGRLVRSGFLNMVSIGADPQREEIVTEANGTQTLVFRQWKLYDISIVPMGSNDDALITARAKQFSLGVGSLKNVEKQLREATDGISDEKVQEVADELSPEAAVEGAAPVETPAPVVEAPAEAKDIEESVNVEVQNLEDGTAQVTVEVPVGEEKRIKVLKTVKVRETKAQIKHREYFAEWQKTGKQYRSLLAKLYARIGETPTGDEKADVERMISLILPSEQRQVTAPARAPVVETRQLQKEDVAELAPKLGAALAPAMRQAVAMLVRSGKPLRKMDQYIEEAATEMTKNLSI